MGKMGRVGEDEKTFGSAQDRLLKVTDCRVGLGFVFICVICVRNLPLN